ncbi:MAG: type I-U CRISPR-associated protein Cas8c [Gammaproteobacteria bacterium]|nr:type I-U CRISPR-associated protein Cas8c [Gammaproteobacteria bacterium]
MARGCIPVDLFNPGQVFACLGFLEAADQLLGDASGGFDWRGDEPCFRLSASCDDDPFDTILRFLSGCQVNSISPDQNRLTTAKWDVESEEPDEKDVFPISPPDSPATLPVRLTGKLNATGARLEIDHWGDSTQRDNVKFWAGAGGYPGAALFRDALNAVRDQLVSHAHAPFALSCPQSSSFRLDWRRDYIPLTAGFSPNLHGDVTMVGFPVVEMLAVIGLSHARPRKTERNKLEYRYSVLGLSGTDELYDPIFLRAALGGADLGFPRRDFLMQLGWPGQENQARCITDVIEETSA